MNAVNQVNSNNLNLPWQLELAVNTNELEIMHCLLS